MRTDDIRVVLCNLITINGAVNRAIGFLLDGSLPAEEEIAVGNSLARGGRALERHGKRRLAAAQQPVDSTDGTQDSDEPAAHRRPDAGGRQSRRAVNPDQG
jgi:hypothetical protein